MAPPRKRVVVQCANCGTEIEQTLSRARRSKNHFCDNHCQAEWMSTDANPGRKKVSTTCEVCGTVFEVSPSRQMQRFCSRECDNRWRVGQFSGRCNGRWVERTETSCEQCGQTITVTPGQAKRKRFCSKECMNTWLRDYMARDKTHLWAGGPLTTYCSTCGNELQRAQYRVKTYRNQFCDKTCYGKWLADSNAGANSHLWKGGQSRKYYGPNWNQQKRLARKRDGYRCQVCGKTQKENGQALDVHHIIPFRDFGYVPGENNNYLQANALSNLLSLCRCCHMKAEVGHVPLQLKLL